MKTKERTNKPAAPALLGQWLSTAGHRVADRLNAYTARWPPALWKAVLMLLCIIVGSCCLLVAFGIFH